MFRRSARHHVRTLTIVAAAASMVGLAGAATPTAASPAIARHAVAHSSTASHWKAIHGDTTNGLACPTTHLCVGIDANKVTWTTNPTAAKPRWKHVALEPSSQPNVSGEVILDALTCSGPHFCLAADDIGNTFATTNPSAGKGAWHGAEIDNIEILGISCSSPSMCAALDYFGFALTSTNAGAASPVWSKVASGFGTSASLYGVSCAGRSVCVAVEDDARIAYTDDPTAGAPKWHFARAGHHVWDAVSCPTASKCVAVSDFGGQHEVAVSTHPSGGSRSWKTSKVPAPRAAEGTYLIDCATASFCFTGGSNDYSLRAGAKKSAWHSVNSSSNLSQTAVSCASTKWCFVATIDGTLRWHR